MILTTSTYGLFVDIFWFRSRYINGMAVFCGTDVQEIK